MNEKELKRKLMNYCYNIKMFNKQLMLSKSIYEKVKNSEAKIANLRIETIDNFETRIDDILKKMHIEQNSIEEFINIIDQPYKSVIYSRYIALNTFDEIAHEMSFSVQRIYQFHKKGLEILLAHVNELE